MKDWLDISWETILPTVWLNLNLDQEAYRALHDVSFLFDQMEALGKTIDSKFLDKLEAKTRGLGVLDSPEEKATLSASIKRNLASLTASPSSVLAKMLADFSPDSEKLKQQIKTIQARDDLSKFKKASLIHQMRHAERHKRSFDYAKFTFMATALLTMVVKYHGQYGSFLEKVQNEFYEHLREIMESNCGIGVCCSIIQ